MTTSSSSSSSALIGDYDATEHARLAQAVSDAEAAEVAYLLSCVQKLRQDENFDEYCAQVAVNDGSLDGSVRDVVAMGIGGGEIWIQCEYGDIEDAEKNEFGLGDLACHSERVRVLRGILKVYG